MTSAIIVAAGSSLRMGFDKLSADLAGKPVLAHTLVAFENCAAIDEIIVVTTPDQRGFVRDVCARFAITRLADVVDGGRERHLSVWNGMESAATEADLIAVHDGARPLITPSAIESSVEAARQMGAAALAHRIIDTLKRADPETHQVVDSVSRDNLWAMETPQVFSADLLRKAYRRVIDSGETVTDEVSAVEQIGESVQLVENAEPNPKITFPADVGIAEAILASREKR